MGRGFDAHCHLPLRESTWSGQVQVVCGTALADWAALLEAAATRKGVLPMLGLHPWQAAAAPTQWASHLEALLRQHRAGVGECGLDFSLRGVDRSAQEDAFRRQLRLAQALHRPVAIHAVRAWGRLIEVLQEEGVPPAGALVHAFGGSPEMARRLQAMGLHLSFSGDLLKPGREALGATLRAVAQDRLLLESDGSAHWAQVLEVAAHTLGVPAEDLAAQTWENGQRCFKELLA